MAGYDGNVIHKSHDQWGRIVVAQRNLVRSLYFDSPYKQSSVSLLHPAVLVLEYTQVMMGSLLLSPSPRNVLIVGLGGGTLANFLLHYLSDIKIDAVELREKVVKVAHGYFNLPDDDPRLSIHIAEGGAFIQESCKKASCHYDLILLDAFTDAGPSDSVANAGLFHACKPLLTATGMLVVNLWNRPSDHFSKTWREVRSGYNDQALRLALGRSNSNVVVFASNRQLPKLDSEQLKKRAQELEERLGLDFPSMRRLLHQQNRSILSRLLPP